MADTEIQTLKHTYKGCPTVQDGLAVVTALERAGNHEEAEHFALQLFCTNPTAVTEHYIGRGRVTEAEQLCTAVLLADYPKYAPQLGRAGILVTEAYAKAGQFDASERLSALLTGYLSDDYTHTGTLEIFVRNSRIRAEDKDNLENVVDELKDLHFRVWITGSAIERQDYEDIDLVVRTRSEIAYAHLIRESLHRLEEITQNLLDHRSGLQRLHSLLFRLQRDYSVNILRSYEIVEPGMFYVASTIRNRYVLDVNGTMLDISYAEQPFDQRPDAKRYQL